MDNNKNSFWENMWAFLLVLVIISLFVNFVEWIIDTIKKGDWVTLVVWVIVTYLLCLYFNVI